MYTNEKIIKSKETFKSENTYKPEIPEKLNIETENVKSNDSELIKKIKELFDADEYNFN